MSTKLELEAWQRVAGLAQSPSHDFHHIDRVQAYADALGQALNVDTEVVRLAAILHDLGRGDENRRHGLSSIEASKEMAEDVLRDLRISDDTRRAVIEAIESHDQPDLTPETASARILKDSDFLAGFGAWGILRIAMWSGETGRRVDDVLRRMTAGMQRRLNSLEYPESRNAARRELIFARQFQAELDRPATLGPAPHQGFYCVIEGTSGVGKNTVADAISGTLKSRGVVHRLVEEPGETFRALRTQLPDRSSELSIPVKKALLMADRADQFARTVNPSLARGEVIISVRSYLSTAVYQSVDSAEAYRTMLEHAWVPASDLLVLLDADVQTAHARIQQRDKPAGEFETPEQLGLHRGRYLDFVSAFPSWDTRIVDATRPTDEVVEEVTKAVLERLDARRTQQ